MWFFLIGLIIGIIAFTSIDLLVKRHNKKKALNSEIEDNIKELK